MQRKKSVSANHPEKQSLSPLGNHFLFCGNCRNASHVIDIQSYINIMQYILVQKKQIPLSCADSHKIRYRAFPAPISVAAQPGPNCHRLFCPMLKGFVSSFRRYSVHDSLSSQHCPRMSYYVCAALAFTWSLSLQYTFFNSISKPVVKSNNI